MQQKKENHICDSLRWLRGHDSNVRPPGYEPDELPTALPRDIVVQIYSFFDTSQVNWVFYFFREQ